ncbi:MAG TPA: response regulator transcription factor [Geomonas sp.]|nr:response regulator transcription factor [Geomonas sp.]
MIKIMIVDDHSIVREGISRLLESCCGDLAVVGTAASGEAALRLVGELAPDVVVMDVVMPGMSGIDATREIVSDHPGIRVLMLSMHKEKKTVAQALKAGAHGYLLKDRLSAELAQAIREVHAGRLYLCSDIVAVVIEDYLKRVPEAESEVVLSLREREILRLIAEGKNSKTIAFLLDINVKTVDTHRQRLMKKLRMRSVAELTSYAVREGITSSDR